MRGLEMMGEIGVEIHVTIQSGKEARDRDANPCSSLASVRPVPCGTPHSPRGSMKGLQDEFVSRCL